MSFLMLVRELESVSTELVTKSILLLLELLVVSISYTPLQEKV